MTETTTEVATQEQAASVPQPEEQPAEAVTTPVSEPTPTNPDEPTETNGEPAKPDNSEESLDPVAFWAKKGIDITTPEGLAKATQSYDAAEKKMHESTQRSSELEKQLTSTPPQVSDDPMVQALADQVFQMQQVQEVREFIRENSVTDDQRQQFAQWFADNPTKQALVDNGYMTVAEAYQLSGISKLDTNAIREAGKKEAREELAHKQRSTAVSGAASAPSLPETKTDPILEVLLSD